jgi:glutamine amidotransferase-like uncharacterized protein
MLIEIIRKSIFLFIILLIIQPFSAIALMDNQIFSDKNLNDLANKNDNDIFGFIISYPSSLEISNNQEIQYKTLNMINDLARNNINIYWITKDIELFTKNILSTQLPENRIFSKGSFIIPFTGQNSKDIISTIIISEYSNNGSILNVENISKNIYFIIEPIQDIKLYRITEPKIAYYFDQGVTTRCINWYMSALYKAGFLNNEILDDNDLSSKLENMRSNVLIWPGGNMFESFKKDLSFISILKRQYSIKNFVSNGGGFVGSCYGAFIASSGMRFTPFLLLQYYFPRFPSIGFFSFSDTLLGIGMPSTINVSIESTDSPVVFGLNGTLTGSVIRGGPVYTYIGKNSESLAKVEDIDLSWLHWIDSLNNSVPRKILNSWANFTIGKTIWISSEYNKGKIVTFGDHPEQGDIKLQRAVHNSVLYVRSELIVKNNFQNFYPNLYVKNIINSSIDSLIEYNDINIFYKEFSRLYDLIDIINLIEIKYNTFTDLVNNLRDNENIETNFYYQMMSAGFWEFKEFINNSKNSLDNSVSDDDTIHNLEIVSSLSHLFSLENITIEDKIDILRDELNNRLKKINLSLNSLDNNMNKIIKEIQNYENTSEQNEYIINLIENIKKDSKEIVKNLPLIYFNSIMDSRDLSFSYKYELINKI